MQQSEPTPGGNQPLTFVTMTFFGLVALALGLALIFFAHAHERAYLFLAPGAGGIIGGVAGIVGAASRTRTALSYGVIASGIMGFTIGLNYFADRYGPLQNQTHVTLVIAMSLVVILAGIAGALSDPSRGRMAILCSVITLR